MNSPSAGETPPARAPSSSLHIVWVLPHLLGTYGDGGNVIVLRQRLRWRGIAVHVTPTTPRDPLPSNGDLYVLGGGEDWAQEAALDLLDAARHRRTLQGPSPVFAVCAGLQILGNSLPRPDGRQRRGLELLDATTVRGRQRAIGEVIAEADPSLALGRLAGFVNHAGSTTLGSSSRPLARIVSGPGNSRDPSLGEGACQDNILATYLHGPVLARNPGLADLLLAKAVGYALPQLAPTRPDRPAEEAGPAAETGAAPTPWRPRPEQELPSGLRSRSASATRG